MDDATPCAICALVDQEPLGGWVHRDEHFVAGTLAGLEVPGWIVLALRRHAVDASPLEAAEAEDLGGVVRAISDALADVTGAPRVYLQAYGEREPHWHLLIAARGEEIPPEHRHIAFFEQRARYVDPEACEAVVRRVRAALAASEDGAEVAS